MAGREPFINALQDNRNQPLSTESPAPLPTAASQTVAVRITTHAPGALLPVLGMPVAARTANAFLKAGAGSISLMAGTEARARLEGFLPSGRVCWEEEPGPGAALVVDGSLLIHVRAAQAMLAGGEPGAGLVVQVRAPGDVARAESMLLAAVRKPTDGIVSRNLNRPISIAISRRLSWTGVTPNQVTLANLIVGLAAAAAATSGSYAGLLAAGVLFHLASVFDGVDGELAKLTFRDSQGGEWIDTLADNVTYLAFFAGLALGIERTGWPAWFATAGWICVATGVLTLASQYLYLVQSRRGTLLAISYGYERGDTGLKRAIRVIGDLLFRRDSFAFATMLLAVAGVLPVILPFVAVTATLGLLPATIWANVRRWRGD